MLLQPLLDAATNQNIESTTKCKLLGITLQADLSWRSHCEAVLSTARSRLHLLHTMRKAGADESVLRTLYSALIRSVLSYAFPAWCNIGKTLLSSLEKLEARISKILSFQLPITLPEYLQRSCVNLATQAALPGHPLGVIFNRDASRYLQRLQRRHRKILARTERFKNHFIKFA